MNKALYIIIFLFIKGHSQTISPNLLSFPVSPEAAKLGTYGDININVACGLPQQSVELFNGNVGDYNFPITLNYNYPGFRVEDTPSIIGLGWQLNCGGVISREIRGLPDEHPRGYYGSNGLVQGMINQYITTGTQTDLVAGQMTEMYDTEADKYIVSVNGINFSFKIGLDRTPVFLTEHNYKLDITWNGTQHEILKFLLTDTNGNRYLFDSMHRERNSTVVGTATLFDDNFMDYVSSYQLSKITLNNAEEIIFAYSDDDYFTYNFYATGKDFIFNGQQHYSQGSSKDLIKRKLLSSITSTKFNVDFTKTILNSHDVYNQITIKDYNNKVIDRFNFAYTGNRNLLKKITRNADFFYEFNYNSETSHVGFINSNTQFPWNQDIWGFANGATNSYGVNIPGTSYSANKKPSFQHTVQCALTTVRYPTKGTSAIFYEQNQISGWNIVNNELSMNSRIHLKFQTDNIPTAPLQKSKTFTKTFTEHVLAKLGHKIQNFTGSEITVSIKSIPSSCNNGLWGTSPYYNVISQMQSFWGDGVNICPNLSDGLGDGCMTDSCLTEKNSGGNFVLAAGTYEFKIATDDNRKNSNAEILLEYYDPALDLNQQTFVNELTGGIRVSRIIDSPITGSAVTKFYDYTAPYSETDYNNQLYKNRLNSTGLLHTNLVDRLDTKLQYFVPPPQSDTWPVQDVKEYTAKSFNQILRKGIPVFYTEVREYSEVIELNTPFTFQCTGCGGDLRNTDNSQVWSYIGPGNKNRRYPKGYKVSRVSYYSNLGRDIYPFTPKGEELSSALPVVTKVYNASESNYFHKPLYVENNDYEILRHDSVAYPNPNYPKSIRMGYKIKRGGWATGNMPSFATVNDYYIFDIYREYDYESRRTGTIKKEYFNNLAVENTTDIQYDSRNQIRKVTTYDSENISSTIETFYPYDFTDGVSTNMVSKNVISPVVKTVEKKGTEILKTLKFDYASLGNNLFKPSAYLEIKNSDTVEKRATFGYDTSGNLTSQRTVMMDPPQIPGSLKDPMTFVIWGYNKSVPIAKIAATAELSIPNGTILSLQSLSNLDDGTCASCEQNLVNALNALRTTYAPTGAMITTYTYNPLVGITTMTDSKGDQVTYMYDIKNRLRWVKDKQGNILSKNEYHYQP